MKTLMRFLKIFTSNPKALAGREVENSVIIVEQEVNLVAFSTEQEINGVVEGIAEQEVKAVLKGIAERGVAVVIKEIKEQEVVAAVVKGILSVFLNTIEIHLIRQIQFMLVVLVKQASKKLKKFSFNNPCILLAFES